MTDQAEDFDEDLGAAIEDLMAGVVKLDKTPADKKLADVRRLEGKLKQAREVLKQFEAEIRELPKSDAANFVPRASEHKESLMEIDDRLKKHKAAAEASGAPAPERKERTTEEIIDEAKKVQEKSAQSVNRSKKIVDDIIDVGGATVQQLKDDTNTLERANMKMEDVQSELALARKQMVAFARNMATDRIIRAFMILILVGTIVVLGVGIWRRTIGPGSGAPAGPPA